MKLKLTYLLAIFAMVFTSCVDECENVDCGANGFCNEEDGSCDCNEGWSGSDCSIFGGGTNLAQQLTNDLTLAANGSYAVDGKLVVNDGATLTIGCGSIIKFANGQGADASALIVARGGKIICDCTSSNPIIFTSQTDNIEIGQLVGTNLTENDNNLWGGLIILGKAPISVSSGTEASIEGLPATEWSKYGGSEIADNSGILKYVSVRHGGTNIGADNEINGITFGGVGNGTTVENIEVIANQDDGVEFFGGSVNVTNVVVGFQGDDGIDVDQNYSGTVDNFVVVHGINDGLEIDGPEGSLEDGFFTLINGTLISVGTDNRAGTFKSLAQGNISNVKAENYGLGRYFRVRASFDNDATANCEAKSDAFSNLVDNKLVFDGIEMVNATFVSDFVSVYPDNSDDPCTLIGTEEVECDNITTGNTNNQNSQTGADIQVFDNWTWMAINGKL